MEPPYNEGPRDWQNVLAIARFCYKLSRFFSIYLTITGVLLQCVQVTMVISFRFCCLLVFHEHLLNNNYSHNTINIPDSLISGVQFSDIRKFYIKVIN